jgi:diguanylate cyclase (GGDEF)-like protein
VANHEQFLEFLEREWRRARRDGQPLTLIFIDVDHFRAFNRDFGRQAGDEVLKQVGRALAGIVGRPGDLVARYHRDEFAIVMASTDASGAFNISEQVRKAIESLDVAAAKDAPASVVTASVATATAVPQRESAWEELDLIKAARHALREARATGGNRVLRANLGTAGPPELVNR